MPLKSILEFTTHRIHQHNKMVSAYATELGWFDSRELTTALNQSGLWVADNKSTTQTSVGEKNLLEGLSAMCSQNMCLRDPLWECDWTQLVSAWLHAEIRRVLTEPGPVSLGGARFSR